MKMRKYIHRTTKIEANKVNDGYGFLFCDRNYWIPKSIVEDNPDWEECKPEKILTTIDGVGIFDENQTIFYVSCNTKFLGNCKIGALLHPASIKIFSTLEARSNYLIMNTPILCLEEFFQMLYLDPYVKQSIIQLAKNKFLETK